MNACKPLCLGDILVRLAAVCAIMAAVAGVAIAVSAGSVHLQETPVLEPDVLVHFCGPCFDRYAHQIDVESFELNGETAYVNGRSIPTNQLYARVDGAWRNLAILLEHDTRGGLDELPQGLSIVPVPVE